MEKVEKVAKFLKTQTMILGGDGPEFRPHCSFLLLPVTVGEIWRWEFF